MKLYETIWKKNENYMKIYGNYKKKRMKLYENYMKKFKRDGYDALNY